MRKILKTVIFAFALSIILSGAVRVKADDGITFQTYYTNPDTGHCVEICNQGGLLTDDEISSLAVKMQEATAYGDIIFIDTYECRYRTSAEIVNVVSSHVGSGDATVLIITLDDRDVYIESFGKNYNYITSAKARSITDNVFRLAGKEDYYGCAVSAIEQITTVLSGGRIAQPMKHISNALLAVVSGLLLNIIFVKMTTSHSKPSTDELFENLETGYIDTAGIQEQFIRQTRHYSPQSSGSSGGGGGHGGGGGGHGGGGHHF